MRTPIERVFAPCSCLARVCVGTARLAATGSKKTPQTGAERPAVADTAFVCLRKCAPFSSEGKNSIASLRRMHFSLGNNDIYKNGVAEAPTWKTTSFVECTFP